ncbi:MAG TPA: protease inhibitor I42 family protein [Candidatus Bipolaricaulis sp.]|nr:protease inhibitor I42 family protein [Candidatus Bipolaricaulis sp.]HRS14424.1 protease inhibitor I42 family protein [Candidatus Bipolaricaulis sp.]HRU21242.1 protease inhibitor I42 family protein [Candidatus Bipolaricaulis sp.]
MRTVRLALLLVAGLAIGSFGQALGTATSSISPEEVRVTTGVFTFSQGQGLAVELTGDDPCPCTCGTIFVSAFLVLDPSGAVVYADEATAYPLPSDEWLGHWDLTTLEGEPVAEGEYTLLVVTSIGDFQAELQVTAPDAAPRAGWSMAEATVCGIGLALYRWVDERDEGTTASLNVGERLLIALPGNPTTGYGWEAVEEPAFLARLEGLPYRADSRLIGAGGVFYFRYQATETGEGNLSFAYRRSWETAPPENTFTLTVIVR